MTTRQNSKPRPPHSVVLKKASAIARPVAASKPVPEKTKLKVIAALKRLHPMD